MATSSTKESFFSEIKNSLQQFAPFFRTIRFKMAFLYSGILYLFAAGMVLTFNIFLGNNLRKNPQPQQVQVVPFYSHNGTIIFDDFEQLKIEERTRIKNIRLNDLRTVQKMSLISLIPLALLSFTAGYYISGKFLDPLDRLKKNLESLESKDLGIHFDSENEDEVGSLIHSFNDLSSRLRDAFHTQEQFVQNASHELRTPLTVIQTNLDTVLDNPTATKEEMTTAINQALGGVKQLKKLVNYLLELTALRQNNFKEVSLQSVIAEQIDITKQSNHSAIIKLQANPKVKYNVLGDQQLLGRVVMNLLENAQKYTSDTTKPITVTLEKTKKTIIISVANFGEKISKESQTKLFDRFYQIDPSRSKKLGGYGLGLSIARKIIEEHRGKIFVTSESNINTFTVELPGVK